MSPNGRHFLCKYWVVVEVLLKTRGLCHSVTQPLLCDASKSEAWLCAPYGVALESETTWANEITISEDAQFICSTL